MERKAARIESELASIDKQRIFTVKNWSGSENNQKPGRLNQKAASMHFTDVESRAKKRIEDQQVELQVKMTRLGGKIVEMKKVYKEFGEKKILRGFDYTFKKGERVGVIGQNGAGKSTFVNILQGDEPVDSGKVNIGDTVVFGNYSQQGLDH
jgi:ATP-binding cassette subfamily F protein uup